MFDSTRIVRLARVSAHMHPDDAADLRWYFRSGGVALLQTSNWGAQLERLDQFRYGADPCKDCGGSRETGQYGCGFELLRKAKPRVSATASANLALLMGEKILADLDRDLPEMSGRLCRSCEGLGVIPKRPKRHAPEAVTVWPTGSSKHGKSGRDIDHADLGRLGSVLRRLAELRDNVAALATLEAYYGPDADGTTWPLLPLTRTGRRMIGANPRQLQPLRLLENMLNEANDKCDAARRQQFNDAKAEARDLLRDAIKDWNLSREDERQRDAERRKAREAS